MDYRVLGQSGLKVSRAYLGGMNFGSSADVPCGDPDAQAEID